MGRVFQAGLNWKNIAKFLSDRFTIANDGYPTFTKKGVHTAIDITAFCGSIVVDNWYHFMPVGRTHHDVLEYDIIATAAEPLNLHLIQDVGSPSDRMTPKINWKKVNWPRFIARSEYVRNSFKPSLASLPKPQSKFIS